MESKACHKLSVAKHVINFDDLNEEQVVVTHVETPEKFYCRLASDENLFNEMNELIYSRVSSPFTDHLMPVSPKVEDNLLAYSTIHQIWCRSRVDEVLNGSDGQKKSVKAYLIDFGSTEVVTYDNLRITTDEIIEFNSGLSFCFECRLALIKPYVETQEWSSYANYMFEKQTKDKIIRLEFTEYVDGVVVCDLQVLWPNDPSMSIQSMADFLVQTRVAKYMLGYGRYHKRLPNAMVGPDYDHQNPNPEDFEWNSDEDVAIVNYNDENKLFYS